MPLYSFRCEHCDREKEIFRKAMSPPKRVVCYPCHKLMYREFTARAQKFTPFITEDVTGKPIEMKTAKQRDAILAKHGLTMDTNKFGGNSPKRNTWDEQLDFGAVKELAEKIEGEYTKTGKRRTHVSEDPELAHLPLYPNKMEKKNDGATKAS